MTPSVDFTTEAGSPPIEISKLDLVLDDIATELTNSIAADGQTSPSAALKMNGFNHTNVGAATALTHYARLTEVIDQDHIYYVDSGSANTYAITPSPAIAAYEEGQRFVFRAANASSGASTLNVNGLGAIAIQTNDGSALITNSIVAGGYYEVTYDANATPDRWVLTSPSSRLPDGMLSSNVALRNNSNSWSTHQLPSGNGAQNLGATANRWATIFGSSFADGSDALLASSSTTVLLGSGASWTAIQCTLPVAAAGNTSAQEIGYRGTPQNAQNGDYTLVLADAGKTIYKASGASGETVTIPANGTVAFPVGTIVRVVNNGGGTLSIAITTDTLSFAGVGTTGTRTLSDHGVAVLEKVATTEWFISGIGLS
jgi:hypothetical protein